MANHWYFGNIDKKEYIECPYDCPTKRYDYSKKENCIFGLLVALCVEDWYGQSIQLILDCPWHGWGSDGDQWKNITEKALERYRLSYGNKIDLLHEEQLKNRQEKKEQHA